MQADLGASCARCDSLSHACPGDSFVKLARRSWSDGSDTRSEFSI